LYGPVGYTTVQDNALGPNSISPSQIAKEFNWYLLGVPMRRSQLYAQNKYGPFGFATGIASTGDR
ncbi:MAG: cellulose biosynthesis protein BcsN, partial [Bauldia sp.]|nr:cellulose biosynthesis protein BcsN [Bauldia sp.]